MSKKKCKHHRLKRRIIERDDFKGPGEYSGYCTQQCKRTITFMITREDILYVYPDGKPELNP